MNLSLTIAPVSHLPPSTTPSKSPFPYPFSDFGQHCDVVESCRYDSTTSQLNWTVVFSQNSFFFVKFDQFRPVFTTLVQLKNFRKSHFFPFFAAPGLKIAKSRGSRLCLGAPHKKKNFGQNLFFFVKSDQFRPVLTTLVEVKKFRFFLGKKSLFFTFLALPGPKIAKSRGSRLSLRAPHKEFFFSSKLIFFVKSDQFRPVLSTLVEVKNF